MGVGFRPKTGESVFWKDKKVTTFTDTGDIFPNTPELFKARYGRFHEEANLMVDAETITSNVGRGLHFAAKDPGNPWGLRPSGDGEATILESTDFAATRMPQGWLSSLLKTRYYDPNVGVVGMPPTPPQPPIPQPPVPPVPPPKPTPQPEPSPPVPPAAGLGKLLPASQRVEELVMLWDLVADNASMPTTLSWVDFLLDKAWPESKPFFVEALRFYRLLRRKLGDERAIPQEDR